MLLDSIRDSNALARDFSPITRPILSSLVTRNKFASLSLSFSTLTTITIPRSGVFLFSTYCSLSRSFLCFSRPRRWSVRVYCACRAHKWICRQVGTQETRRAERTRRSDRARSKRVGREGEEATCRESRVPRGFFPQVLSSVGYPPRPADYERIYR